MRLTNQARNPCGDGPQRVFCHCVCQLVDINASIKLSSETEEIETDHIKAHFRGGGQLRLSWPPHDFSVTWCGTLNCILPLFLAQWWSSRGLHLLSILMEQRNMS